MKMQIICNVHKTKSFFSNSLMFDESFFEKKKILRCFTQQQFNSVKRLVRPKAKIKRNVDLLSLVSFGFICYK